MFRFILVVLVTTIFATAGFATEPVRLALLIGNQAYKGGVGELKNPLNDIRLVGDALKSTGFVLVPTISNGTREQMLLAIQDYAIRLRDAGPDAIGFLYYSGHGMASAGENYLIPIDVDEPSTRVLSVKGVKQSEVLAILRDEAPNAAHYLVLDACRNELRGTRGGKGFIAVREQSGVLIAFAAEPGKTASDAGEASGPYAAALAGQIVKPGIDDLNMFHNVRVSVLDKTRGDQVPWTEDGIQRAERFKFGGGKMALSSPVPTVNVAIDPGPSAKIAVKTAATTEPGHVFRDCDLCPEMVVVPAGSFVMGSSDGAEDEKPPHHVSISKPLAVGRFTVTVREYLTCVRSGKCKEPEWREVGSKYNVETGSQEEAINYRNRGPALKADSNPIVGISWANARAYADWLSSLTGQKYRLLTEAEWEYSARAGTSFNYFWGDDIGTGNANCGKCGSQWDDDLTTSPVGSFSANAFGLYDMHGNVLQWVQDCYRDSYSGAPTDGSAVTIGDCNRRVTRGGAWYDKPRELRAAARDGKDYYHRSWGIGFRIARTL